MPKVSVIIPIYRAEQYIVRCAKSLFEQTLDDIEYIFVDDKSPDNSILLLESVAKEYPNRISQIRILHHEQNEGSAGARNTGLDAAVGEYVIHCDSDDWVDKDTYDLAYNKAKSVDADIVFFGAYWEFSNFTKPAYPFTFKNSEDAFKASLSGVMHNAMWNKLIKRSLFTANNIRWVNGVNMQEDASVMPKLIYFANTISTLGGCYYHYFQGNVDSYTHHWNQANFANCIQVVDILKNFLKEEKIYDQYMKYLAYYQCFIKSSMLYYADMSYVERLFHLFPEIKEYIQECPTIDEKSKSELSSLKKLKLNKRKIEYKRRLKNLLSLVRK